MSDLWLGRIFLGVAASMALVAVARVFSNEIANAALSCINILGWICAFVVLRHREAR